MANSLALRPLKIASCSEITDLPLPDVSVACLQMYFVMREIPSFPVEHIAFPFGRRAITHLLTASCTRLGYGSRTTLLL